jgi:hypothetical protein
MTGRPLRIKVGVLLTPICCDIWYSCCTSRCIFARVKTFIELIGIKSKLRSEALEVVFVERALVFSVLGNVQEIVVFPKRILFCSAFAGFRGPLRLRSKKCEMNIPEPYILLFT